MNKLLSLKDAAECLAISPKKLERLVKKGKLPAYKIGGSYLRFKKEDIESFKEAAYGNIGFAVSNKKKGPLHVKKYIFFDAAKDFFYFNSFYIIAVIIAIIMIIIILKF